MNATTVKIDSRMILALTRIKRTDQSLTTLVRELLQAEIGRRRMSESANQSAEFLRTTPDEVEEKEIWASASLDEKPKGSRKRRS